ncbi:MAG TPA: hypothetical protein VGI75_08995, partial [Pirellulales bacterium]
MAAILSSTDAPILEGQRIALVGRLASMSKRDAGQLIRRLGGMLVESPASINRNDAMPTIVELAESATSSVGTSTSDCSLIVVGEDMGVSAEGGSTAL